MTAMAFGPTVSGYARKLPEWPFYIVGVMPAAWMMWQAVNGQLGVDPVKTLEHQYGLWALQFLLASLCITPLMRFARINLVKFRRPLGLLGALYVLFHFLVWLLLDLQLRWGQIGEELTKRPYIVVGFVALLLLIPLAATSWQGAMRRMGAQAWKRLHMLSYVIVPLGAVHYMMQEKVWTSELIAYMAAAFGLVALRVIWIRRI